MDIHQLTAALAHTIAERKEAVVKEKALKDELMNQLAKLGKDKEETPFGIFTIAHRPKYTFSKAIQKREEALKIAKVDAIEQGKVTVEMSDYVLFKEAKE